MPERTSQDASRSMTPTSAGNVRRQARTRRGRQDAPCGRRRNEIGRKAHPRQAQARRRLRQCFDLILCKVQLGCHMRGRQRCPPLLHRCHRCWMLASGYKTPAFKWVNTALGNIKVAITGTYRSIRQKHVPRYLAEFGYRFNRRYDLAAMMPRLSWAYLRTSQYHTASSNWLSVMRNQECDCVRVLGNSAKN